MAVDAKKVNLRSITVTKDLDKIFYDVAIEDLEKTLRYVAAEEILNQVRIDNKPTSLLVDNSGRDINIAKKRVRAFFADTAQLYEALTVCYAYIRSLVPRRSGRAAFSYEVWLNDRRVGRDPFEIRALIENMDPSKDFVRIVGPVVAYGRKVNYNPGGTRRFTKRTVARTRTTVIKSVKIQGIMERVEKMVGRRYPALYVRESWVTTSALPKDGRTPGLVIGFAKRGRLKGV